MRRLTCIFVVPKGTNRFSHKMAHISLYMLKNCDTLGSNVLLFFTSKNEILEIFYSLFRGRQNIFLTIFSTKFVINVHQLF